MTKRIKIKEIDLKNVKYKIYLEKKGDNELKYYLVRKFKKIFNIPFQWYLKGKEEIASYDLKNIIDNVIDDVKIDRVK